MIEKLVSYSYLVVAAVALTSACTADPPIEEGGLSVDRGSGGALLDPCDKDRPCGPKLQCEFHFCVGSAGAGCAADAHCSQIYGLVCRPGEVMGAEQRCAVPALPGEPCREASDCRMGACGPGTGACANVLNTPCHLNADCLAGLRCRFESRSGKRLCLALGSGNEFCDDDSDCAEGRPCQTGLCQVRSGEKCLSDNACPDSHLCLPLGPDGSARSCRPPEPVAGAFCMDRSGCKAPLLCINKRCVKPEDAPCTDSMECAMGLVCRGGECLMPGRKGDSCADASNQPRDSLCATGMLCNAKKLTCVDPASVVEGEACTRDAECAMHAAGVAMKCHAKLQICALPGSVIADVAVSDVQKVSSPADSWTPWQCFEFPAVVTPPGYKIWRYVDTVSHRANGDDAPGFRIAYPNDSKVCVSIFGAKDPLWPWGSKTPTELHFRLNAVAYNPSLMIVNTHPATHSTSCPDTFAGVDNADKQPCITAGEYWYPMALPKDFDGLGLVEVTTYRDPREYASFVSAVASLKELKPRLGDFPGIDVERSLVFATASTQGCGEYIGLRYHGVFWRSGLDVKGYIKHTIVSQTTPIGGVLYDLDYPDPRIAKYLTYLNIRSFNLQADLIRDDTFWDYCGAHKSQAKDEPKTCQPQKPPGNLLPDPIKDALGKAAGEGTEKLCDKFVPVSDLCDAIGKGGEWVAKKLIDLLFGRKTCGSGVDQDAEYRMSKEQTVTGTAFQFEAATGDAKRNDFATISAQVVQLGFKE